MLSTQNAYPLEQATQTYENSPLPSIVTDENLSVLWSNRAAQMVLPSLALTDGLRSLLVAHDIEDTIHTLKQSQIVHYDTLSLPLSSIQIYLIPLFEQGKFVGATAHLLNVSSPHPEVYPDGVERILWTFNNQIREPLTSIFTALTAISRNSQFEKNERSALYIRDINQNCYKLLRCSMSITEYTKYCSGLNELNAKKIDLTEFLTGMCSSLQMMLEPLEISFDFYLPDRPVFVQVDTNKVEIALLNIISNSCRFTRPDNAITMSMTTTDTQVLISIADRGQGIKEEILSYVFDPYFSYTDEGQPFGGTGLGLTLVKIIAVQHGGTVAIHSTENEGTTVGFTLPLDDSSDQLMFHSTASDYLLNRFSNIYIYLSDVCKCPLP